MSELVEVLADIEHRRWAGWMQYMFLKGQFNADGTWTMPVWAVDRWSVQAAEAYSMLSEEEKESDREEVRKTLKAMTDFALKNI